MRGGGGEEGGGVRVRVWRDAAWDRSGAGKLTFVVWDSTGFVFFCQRYFFRFDLCSSLWVKTVYDWFENFSVKIKKPSFMEHSLSRCYFFLMETPG